jgi:hypothetical protein
MSETTYEIYLDGRKFDTVDVPPSAKSGYIGQLALTTVARNEGVLQSHLSATVDNERRMIHVFTD